MANLEKYRSVLLERLLDGNARSTQEQRRAAFANESVPEPARTLVDKVAKYAFKVTDEDVAAVKQTLPEDQVFELAVCAAVGAASRQYETALAALAEATGSALSAGKE